jgi:glucosamine--fructose-6-phosphate aminotransferase (isomerizing)
VLEPAADPDGLTAAVAAAARAEHIPVAELAAPDGSLAPLLAQIPMTVRLQLLAENFARLRRQNPDAAIVGAWNEPELWRMGSLT